MIEVLRLWKCVENSEDLRTREDPAFKSRGGTVALS
jgi:hypothetical protein